MFLEHGDVIAGYFSNDQFADRDLVPAPSPVGAINVLIDDERDPTRILPWNVLANNCLITHFLLIVGDLAGILRGFRAIHAKLAPNPLTGGRRAGWVIQTKGVTDHARHMLRPLQAVNDVYGCGADRSGPLGINQRQERNLLPLGKELSGHFERNQAAQTVASEKVWSVWLYRAQFFKVLACLLLY